MIMMTMTMMNTAMATHKPIYMAMFSLFFASRVPENTKKKQGWIYKAPKMKLSFELSKPF